MWTKENWIAGWHVLNFKCNSRIYMNMAENEGGDTRPRQIGSLEEWTSYILIDGQFRV
jgi:hypothetical protein